MYSFNSWCHHPPRLHTKRWNNNCNCTSHYLFILVYLNVIEYFSFICTFRDDIHVRFISVKPNSSSYSNRKMILTSKLTHKIFFFYFPSSHIHEITRDLDILGHYWFYVSSYSYDYCSNLAGSKLVWNTGQVKSSSGH